MRSPGAQQAALRVQPLLDLPLPIAARPIRSLAAESHRPNRVRRLRKDCVAQGCLGQTRVAQVDAAQIDVAQRELMQVQPGQIAARRAQQRQQVGRRIPLNLVPLPPQRLQQRQQARLQGRGLWQRGAQAGQQRGHQQANLRLANELLAAGQLQPVIAQEIQAPALDLAGRCGDEARRGVVQHDRLQGEAALHLAALDQRAAAQRVQRLQDLRAGQRLDQHVGELGHGHRLAQNGQPQHDALFQGRKARKLLLQQVAHTAKDQLAVLQERGNLAAEQPRDRRRHDLQRQGVAAIALDQTGALGRAARHVQLLQQPLTGAGVELAQAQRANRRPTAFQRRQFAGFFATGKQQAAHVLGLSRAAQKAAIAFITGQHAAAAFCLLHDAFQVVQHQQHTPCPQVLEQEREPSFEAVQHGGQRLARQDAQQVVEQGLAGRGVPQRAPQDGVELIRDLVHERDGQRGLAHAAHTQNANHPAALFQQPIAEERQLVLASVEGRRLWRIAPIGEATRLWTIWGNGWGAQRRSWRSRWLMQLCQQAGQPSFIQRHADTRALPQGADFLGFLAAVKGVVLVTELNEVLEMLRGGIAGAGLPTDYGLARDAKNVRKPRLGQIGSRAQREDLLTEIIVAIVIHRAAHCHLRLSTPLSASR